MNKNLFINQFTEDIKFHYTRMYNMPDLVKVESMIR